MAAAGRLSRASIRVSTVPVGRAAVEARRWVGAQLPALRQERRALGRLRPSAADHAGTSREVAAHDLDVSADRRRGSGRPRAEVVLVLVDVAMVGAGELTDDAALTGRAGPGCRRTAPSRSSSTVTVDQRVAPAGVVLPDHAGSRPRVGDLASSLAHGERLGRRRRTSRYQRRVAAVAAHPLDRGQLRRRRPCRRRPPISRSGSRERASRRRARARRSRTGCRGPARPRRPGSGRRRRPDAGPRVDPLAVRGDRHGQRVTPSLAEAVEEAAAEQPERRPAGDDGVAVRLRRTPPGSAARPGRRSPRPARTVPADVLRQRGPRACPRVGPGRAGGVDAHRTDEPGHGRRDRIPADAPSSGAARTVRGRTSRFAYLWIARRDTRRWLPQVGPGPCRVSTVSTRARGALTPRRG